MKKIINHPDTVVQDMMDGILLAQSHRLQRINDTMVITKKNEIAHNKVALISGGGSGHEPAHVGYIGRGMLDAAILGEVFTSPTVDQIYEAIQTLNNGHGVCLIVKNYTGDVMNFDMATELAREEGIDVEQVIVKDDVATEDDSATTGRRGIAGTIFVHKIAGAKAEQGAPLNEVKLVAEKAIKNIRSMGVALSPCTIPAAENPNFTLEEDEMEIGIGIHGERGLKKTAVQTAPNIVQELMKKINADMPLKTGEEIALLINGMGSTTEMELYILNKEVHAWLKTRGIVVYQSFVGDYMTSLEMGGASITVMKLDDELKTLLQAPSDAPDFPVD